MELEQMKTLWDEMSQQVEKQKILTNKLVIEMTQERYSNKFSKIVMYESMGAVVCFLAALFMIFNFNKLDTWYLMASGIFVLSFLLILPVLVLKSIYNIKSLSISKSNYKQTIIGFTKAKKQLLNLQKVGISMSFILALLIMPVTSKILNNKDFFAVEHSIGFWIFTPIFLIGLFFFARWGYGCYKSVTNSAENILKELED